LVIFTTAVVIERLQPFDFSPVSSGFGWLPFVALVHGSNEHSLITISEKSFLYGTLIWLWVEAGLPRLYVTIGVALLLLLCSFVEMHIATRVAETTDAVMALFLGGVIKLLVSKPSNCDPVQRPHAGMVCPLSNHDQLSPCPGSPNVSAAGPNADRS
jgi:hypothetical protein